MKKNLKIGLITPYPPSKTTLNEYGYHLAKHLSTKDEISELQLYTEELDQDLSYTGENDKYKFIPCWGFNRLGNSLAILKQIKKQKPDTVIINLQFLLFGDKKIAAALGLMLPVMLRMFGFKNIVLLHNIMEEVDLEKAGITTNPILKWIFGIVGNLLTRLILQADLVGVTIDKYVEVLKSKYKTKNVVLLPHGAFETPPEPDYKQPEGTLNVMTFGKFGTYKKVEVLIEAVKNLMDRTDLKIDTVIAGTDNPNVPGYLKQVEEQYKDVPNVTFTGYVEEEDVPRIFKESTVVVFPYTSTTGSSGVLHQAGSYGKAAILPNLGDLALLVKEEGYRGEFFEPEDAASLENAIEKLLTDHSYRNELERANFKAASALSLSDIADWYLLHIDHLVSAK